MKVLELTVFKNGEIYSQNYCKKSDLRVCDVVGDLEQIEQEHELRIKLVDIPKKVLEDMPEIDLEF